jgi:hypothetical protein
MSRLSWIVLGVVLIIAAGILVLRSGVSGPATPRPSEPARSFQATPEATLNMMFEMFTQQFAKTFIGVTLISGTNLQPEEQKFAQLFWDNERAGVIYNTLYDREAELMNISSQNRIGDSVRVAVSVKALPSKDADEKVDAVYIFELRQNGPNWYVYELRGEKSPVGVYEKTRQLKESGASP